MNIVNNSLARESFDIAAAAVIKAGYTVQGTKLAPGYLRSEMAINATTTTYKIPILITDTSNGTPFNTEQRLNLQDSFFIAEIGIFLAVPTGTTDAAFEVLTYPDPTLFATSGAARSTNTLYNGKLIASVNNDTINPGWDILRHRIAPHTQDGIIGATGGGTPVNSTDMSTDGFYPVQPVMTNVGSKNINWVISLPAAIATIQANSRIIFIQRGLLAQNCTPVN